MITVDEIRREMEKSGELPCNLIKKEIEMRTEKSIRAIPDTVDQRWIWRARKIELQKVLAERYGVEGASLDGDVKSLRKIAGEKIGRKRRRSAGPSRTVVEKAQRRPKEEARGAPGPRLVLAETFPCPSCGAQLMIQGR